MPEKGQSFPSLNDTSVQHKFFPAVVPLILHLVQIRFLNLLPQNIWEQPGPSWSKSEPLDKQLECKAWETPVHVCQTDLPIGRLEHAGA